MFFLLLLGDDNFKVFELDKQCNRVLFRGKECFNFEVTKLQMAIEEMLSLLEQNFSINKDNIFDSYTPLNKYIVTSGIIADFKYVDENKVVVTLTSMQISSSPIEKPKFLKN